MPTINPQRGEIWRVDLEPTLGEEMRKTRPCVILSLSEVGRLALRVVVPLTGWQESFSSKLWCVQVDAGRGTGLTKTSAADVFQMRSASLLRISERVGVLPNEDLERVVQAATLIIGGNLPDAA